MICSHADRGDDPDALYEDGIDDPRYWTREETAMETTRETTGTDITDALLRLLRERDTLTANDFDLADLDSVGRTREIPINHVTIIGDSIVLGAGERAFRVRVEDAS